MTLAMGTRLGPYGRVIRTVHSYGYAFAAAVEHDGVGSELVSTELSVCVLVSATRSVILRQGEQIAGRDPVSDIWIDSPKISWRHARLLATHAGATIEDLGSKNGTFVRNVRIDGPTVLQHGDEVRFGRSTFLFRVEDARRVTETDLESAPQTSLERRSPAGAVDRWPEHRARRP